MTREEGIAELARMVWPILGGAGTMARYETAHPETRRGVHRDVERALTWRKGTAPYGWNASAWPVFVSSVAECARRLIASGECPALADCKALK